jgi:hypothetical protein
MARYGAYAMATGSAAAILWWLADIIRGGFQEARLGHWSFNIQIRSKSTNEEVEILFSKNPIISGPEPTEYT